MQNNGQAPKQLDIQNDLDKLYEWIMDENRKPAQTYFTSGTARNIAKEIEFRLPNKNRKPPIFGLIV